MELTISKTKLDETRSREGVKCSLYDARSTSKHDVQEEINPQMGLRTLFGVVTSLWPQKVVLRSHFYSEGAELELGSDPTRLMKIVLKGIGYVFPFHVSPLYIRELLNKTVSEDQCLHVFM